MRDKKISGQIYYKFFNIEGRGFCPYRIEEYNIIAESVEVLQAGTFIAKGCIVSIKGGEVFPTPVNMTFYTDADISLNVSNIRGDYENWSGRKSFEIVGVALESAMAKGWVEVCTSGQCKVKVHKMDIEEEY